MNIKQIDGVIVHADGNIFCRNETVLLEFANALIGDSEPVAHYDVQKRSFKWLKPTTFSNIPITFDIPKLPLYTKPQPTEVICVDCLKNAVESEPVAYMWQHEETGNVGFTDQYQIANGFEKNNPRLNIISPLFTKPPSLIAKEAKWISVKDSVPKKGDMVFGYGYWVGEIHGRAKIKSIEYGEWDNGTIYISGDAYSSELVDISHWLRFELPPIDEALKG
jgi:hypothetical protein